MSLPWPGDKTEQVSVAVDSDELRQEVIDLSDCELAGSLRKVSLHRAHKVYIVCIALDHIFGGFTALRVMVSLRRIMDNTLGRQTVGDKVHSRDGNSHDRETRFQSDD